MPARTSFTVDFQIDKLTWLAALNIRYPNLSATHTDFRDSRYRTLERTIVKRLCGEFHAYQRAWMGDERYRWMENKGDCDYWSRRFIAYVLDRNVLSDKTDLKPAVSEIHYVRSDGVRHSINSFCTSSGEIFELEPQPGGGVFSLTNHEADSVWNFDA